MISRIWSRSSLAILTLMAMLSMSSMVALAAPAQGQQRPSGELTASGNVMVDGAKAISGATVFSDSTITTAEKSSAIVNLGKLGRVELMPNSNMKVSFNETGIMATLDAGRARVMTMQGMTANLTTKDGVVVADAAQASNFSVNVECGNTQVSTHAGQVELRAGNETKQIAAGNQDTAGQAAPGTRCTRLQTEGLRSIGGGALAALLLAAGGAIAAAVYATVSDNSDINVDQGGGVIISPIQ
ncbi:MAG: hypothetical protein M3430_05610 [Acidobacteriota bacterium]|nr:hypothetical protein [Acidobacteriota bacterium]